MSEQQLDALRKHLPATMAATYLAAMDVLRLMDRPATSIDLLRQSAATALLRVRLTEMEQWYTMAAAQLGENLTAGDRDQLQQWMAAASRVQVL